MFPLAFLCLLASLAAADNPPPAPSAGGASPWATVVTRNWGRWAKGNDMVSRLDLIGQCSDPGYRGVDAAALTALANYLHRNKLDSIDKSTATALQEDRLLATYQKNIVKLQGISQSLFAPGQPDFATLAQGPAGDCYFFAGAGWLAKYRPSVLTQAIQPLPDGTYRVVFPNGEEAVVARPTDAEMSFNDSASTLQGGVWMPVLEKAMGTIMARAGGRSADIADPTVAIDVPGVPVASIVRRWTGAEVERFRLAVTDPKIFREALVRMHERNLLAEALLLHSNSAHLPWDHVYAILDFEPQTGTLTLWNPLAYDFQPQGPEGLDNGYFTRHGVFRMPLPDFLAIYAFVALERND